MADPTTMADPTNIVLFGGSFDPFHVGHLAILKAIDSHVQQALILVTPAYTSPFKSSTYFSRHQRLGMVSAGIRHLNSSNGNTFAVHRYELDQPHVSYTIDTVRHIQMTYPDLPITICIGSDNVATLPDWKHSVQLAKEVSFLVAKRQGSESTPNNISTSFSITALPFEAVDVSSSNIKAEGYVDKVPEAVSSILSCIIPLATESPSASSVGASQSSAGASTSSMGASQSSAGASTSSMGVSQFSAGASTSSMGVSQFSAGASASAAGSSALPSFSKQKTPIIGLTGGVGTGKSTAGACISRNLDVDVIDLDQVGHDMLKQPTVISALTKLFGADILDKDGQIQRPKLGSIVFSDSKQLALLNQIVHPKIKQHVERVLKNRHQATVLMGALLEEVDILAYCDVVITVTAPPSLIKAAIGDEKFARSEFQNSQQAFERQADIVLTNTFTDQFLRDCVETFKTILKRLR